MDFENEFTNDYGGFISFDDDVCLSTEMEIESSPE